MRRFATRAFTALRQFSRAARDFASEFAFPPRRPSCCAARFTQSHSLPVRTLPAVSSRGFHGRFISSATICASERVAYGFESGSKANPSHTSKPCSVFVTVYFVFMLTLYQAVRMLSSAYFHSAAANNSLQRTARRSRSLSSGVRHSASSLSAELSASFSTRFSTAARRISSLTSATLPVRRIGPRR